MGMIRAEKLVFEYDKRDEEGNVIGSHRAIDGVDIDVPQGSFVAILGHNGSGKSTLAKHMKAILVPTGGTMWVDGRDTKDPNELWSCECSRWSGNLYTASAKCRDDKSGNDRSEDTSFRSYTGCKCQCD